MSPFLGPTFLGNKIHLSGLHYRPDRGTLICSKYVRKSSKIGKKVDNGLCPINVISKKFDQLQHRPDNFFLLVCHLRLSQQMDETDEGWL